MQEYLADAQRHVRSQMESALSTLVKLVAIPSVSWDSFDPAQGVRCAQEVAEYARELGFFDSVDLHTAAIDDTARQGRPAVVARHQAKNGAPTVLLYAHSDVQPPGERGEWATDPFVATRIGDRIFGRGAADDKAGIVSHVESIRALMQLQPECDLGVVLFVEGEEEAGSPSFDSFLAEFKEELAADVIIVADSTNFTAEIPALTVSLRGNVTLNVTVRTLDHALHSGMFGGAVPDAYMAFNQMISSCYAQDGSCSIPGIQGIDMDTPQYTEQQIRSESGVLEGVELIGKGSILNRLWNSPTLTVTGIDLPPVNEASNTLLPSVRARLSLRIPPTIDARSAADAVISYFRDHLPFNAELVCEDVNVGQGYHVVDNDAAQRVREAMRLAWGAEVVDIGVGGSIPFIASFAKEFPDASVLVTGVEDPDSRAHSPNESLHLGAFEKAIVSQALFLASFADQ
jgi:acetylornithine deacetylase/succinyl-diaminopimelate desuccinylase-like protein